MSAGTHSESSGALTVQCFHFFYLISDSGIWIFPRDPESGIGYQIPLTKYATGSSQRNMLGPAPPDWRGRTTDKNFFSIGWSCWRPRFLTRLNKLLWSLWTMAVGTNTSQGRWIRMVLLYFSFSPWVTTRLWSVSGLSGFSGICPGRLWKSPLDEYESVFLVLGSHLSWDSKSVQCWC